MLPCVWLLIPDLVASRITDNNGEAREEDRATHGSDKSKLTLDFLLTLHGTLLVIVVGEGRNDPRWLRVQDDDDDVTVHVLFIKLFVKLWTALLLDLRKIVPYLPQCDF